MKYYELMYFRGRKDSGSIYVKTELDLDTINEDEFLNQLVEKGLLDKSDAEFIVDIDEIDKEIYQDMVGHE